MITTILAILCLLLLTLLFNEIKAHSRTQVELDKAQADNQELKDKLRLRDMIIDSLQGTEVEEV